MCYVTIFEHCWIKPDRERSVMCYVTIFDHCWIKPNRERSVNCYITIFDLSLSGLSLTDEVK